MKSGYLIDKASDTMTKNDLAHRIVKELNSIGKEDNIDTILDLLDSYNKLTDTFFPVRTDYVGERVKVRNSSHEYIINDLDFITKPSGEISDEDMVMAMTRSIFADEIITVITGYGMKDDEDGIHFLRANHFLDGDLIYQNYISYKDVEKVLKPYED